jgi:hypothetical protein
VVGEDGQDALMAALLKEGERQEEARPSPSGPRVVRLASIAPEASCRG